MSTQLIHFICFEVRFLLNGTFRAPGVLRLSIYLLSLLKLHLFVCTSTSHHLRVLLRLKLNVKTLRVWFLRHTISSA